MLFRMHRFRSYQRVNCITELNIPETALCAEFDPNSAVPLIYCLEILPQPLELPLSWVFSSLNRSVFKIFYFDIMQYFYYFQTM